MPVQKGGGLAHCVIVEVPKKMCCSNRLASSGRQPLNKREQGWEKQEERFFLQNGGVQLDFGNQLVFSLLTKWKMWLQNSSRAKTLSFLKTSQEHGDYYRMQWNSFKVPLRGVEIIRTCLCKSLTFSETLPSL